jgi:hypothetical protein
VLLNKLNRDVDIMKLFGKDNNSHYGELPLEMTNLKYLKNISLFDNQFSGVIPQSFNDEGFSSPPNKWKDTCVAIDFNFNKYVITFQTHI